MIHEGGTRKQAPLGTPGWPAGRVYGMGGDGKANRVGFKRARLRRSKQPIAPAGFSAHKIASIQAQHV